MQRQYGTHLMHAQNRSVHLLFTCSSAGCHLPVASSQFHTEKKTDMAVNASTRSRSQRVSKIILC